MQTSKNKHQNKKNKTSNINNKKQVKTYFKVINTITNINTKPNIF